MSAFLLGWGGKILLPILIPLFTTLLKQVIDKFTPIALDKIPKATWMAVVATLSELSTTIAPSMFLFPGFPAWASTLVYTVASMGLREVVDQTIKIVGPSPTQPTGI